MRKSRLSWVALFVFGVIAVGSSQESRTSPVKPPQSPADPEVMTTLPWEIVEPSIKIHLDIMQDFECKNGADLSSWPDSDIIPYIGSKRYLEWVKFNYPDPNE